MFKMFKQKNGRLFDRVLNAAKEGRLSDRDAALQAASQGEANLSPSQQAALEQSLRDAANDGNTAVSARFNADVLVCLQNAELSQSPGRQAVTRLRWMTLPALAGFVAMFGISFAWGRLLCTPPAPADYASMDIAAPPLPPLPVVAPWSPSNAGAKAGAGQHHAPAAMIQTAPSPSAQTPSRADANVKGANHVH